MNSNQDASISQVWFKNRRAKCRMQQQQQNQNSHTGPTGKRGRASKALKQQQSDQQQLHSSANSPPPPVVTNIATPNGQQQPPTPHSQQNQLQQQQSDSDEMGKGSYIRTTSSPLLYPKMYSMKHESMSPNSSSPPGSSQNSSSVGEVSPSSHGYGNMVTGVPTDGNGGSSSPTSAASAAAAAAAAAAASGPTGGALMDAHNYGSFPWHAPLADFHNGCVQRSSPMGYSSYKNSYPTQSYAAAAAAAASPYYGNMSDYFSPSHHPHHAHHQFTHHTQMGSPYHQNFANARAAAECMESYGVSEKYQVL